MGVHFVSVQRWREQGRAPRLHQKRSLVLKCVHRRLLIELQKRTTVKEPPSCRHDSSSPHSASLDGRNRARTNANAQKRKRATNGKRRKSTKKDTNGATPSSSLAPTVVSFDDTSLTNPFVERTAMPFSMVQTVLSKAREMTVPSSNSPVKPVHPSVRHCETYWLQDEFAGVRHPLRRDRNRWMRMKFVFPFTH